MVKKKILYIIITFLLLCYTYNYVSNVKATSDFIQALETERSMFSHVFAGELVNRSDDFPKTKKDIELIFNSIRANSADPQFTFFNHDYGVYYDSLSRCTTIYSYNTDNVEDFSEGRTIRPDSLTFLSLFFKYKSFDIEFVKFCEDSWSYDICGIKNYENLKDKRYVAQFSDIYKLYNRHEILVDDVLLNGFKRDVKSIEMQINGVDLKDYDGATNTYFLRFKENRIKNICNNKLPLDILNKIQTLFLKKRDSSYDYAVFPITLIPPHLDI